MGDSLDNNLDFLLFRESGSMEGHIPPYQNTLDSSEVLDGFGISLNKAPEHFVSTLVRSKAEQNVIKMLE